LKKSECPPKTPIILPSPIIHIDDIVIAVLTEYTLYKSIIIDNNCLLKPIRISLLSNS